MGPEARLEKRLVKCVEEVGGLCWKFTSPGTPGVPDRICILPDGRIVFVEMKAEWGRVSNIQKYRRRQLLDRQCDTRIVKGEQQLKDFMKEVKKAYGVCTAHIPEARD